MKFSVGDKVKDNGKGYPIINGGFVGTVIRFEPDKTEPNIIYLVVEFDHHKNDEWYYKEEELEHA